MAFVPGESRTKVVPDGNRFQARYYDADLRLWFDLGDPRDTVTDASILIDKFNEKD